jgi:hypothetical protein
MGMISVSLARFTTVAGSKTGLFAGLVIVCVIDAVAPIKTESLLHMFFP